ncbi:efflux RND transporter periplasmic adaptor subunit [Thermomicrobium sp.]
MSERRRRSLLIILALVTLAVVAGLWVWLRRPNETVWVVRRGNLTASVEVPGRLVSLRTLPLRASYETRVRLLAVAPGDRVQAGDIVALLDDTPLLTRRAQVEQQLLQAEATLSQAEATDAPLEARLRAEQQRREAARAFDEVTRRLADKYVLAPSDGIVTEVLVSEGAPVTTGSILARLADTSVLGVSATIDEVDARFFAEATIVRVTVDALPGWQGRGDVLGRGESATQQAGVVGFPLLIRLAETTSDLRPGMTATIHLDTIVRHDVLLVPERAIRTVGERAFVTVVTDGRREEREVTLGLRSGGLVEIAAGLAEGERVLLPAGN